jgi:DNA recombination protein RmuC
MQPQVLGVAVVAAVLGLALGAGLVAAGRRAGGSAGGPVEPGLAARLDVQAAELRRLADAAASRDLATEQVRAQLEGARRALELLHAREAERRLVETESRETVRRLSTVLAGSGARGRAGERVLREGLAALPPGMLVTDLGVDGKVVEFALVLPDGRRLPIDSKWTAVAELEALERAAPERRDAAARAVERAVALRAREVARYVDPAVTSPVAVAAVPDAAYAVLKRAHADAYARGVIVVPYGSAMPIVLFLYALVQRYGAATDAAATLADLDAALDAIASVAEHKVARAATMLANGADELRSHVGRAHGSIARARGLVPAEGHAGADRLSVLPDAAHAAGAEAGRPAAGLR